MGWRAWVLSVALGTWCAPLAAQLDPRAASEPPPNPSALARTLVSMITVAPGAGCLEQPRLVAHVKMWVGPSALSPGTRVRVHGLAGRPRALAFDVTRGATTRRRIFDPGPQSCDDAHAVLGLAIALALDEQHTEQLLHAAVPARPRVRRVGLQVTSAYAVLPDASLGGQLGAELGLLSWLSLRFDVLAQYSWHNTIPDSRGQFDALLWAGALEACAGGWLDQRVRLLLCAGPAPGAVRAWGRGYAPDDAATRFWLAVRSGVRLEARLGCTWWLDLDVLSAIYSPTFTANRRSEAALERKPDATGIALSLGPVLAF